jgi:hypothetical protein
MRGDLSHGMSLIEVILAIFLLLLFCSFLLGAECLLLAKKKVIVAKFIEINACANVMEQVLASSFEGLTVYDNYTFLEGRGKVQVANFSTSLKQIRVWVEDAGNPRVLFETIVGNDSLWR